jgi:crotonobetainyl-CoA:carnitine CoA-transferase CaiB-like acyl-CoA transferase
MTVPVAPLHGVRVVDPGRAPAGPYATTRLADAGAEVLDPTPGPISVPGFPLRFDGAPAAGPVAPPLLGQHEDEREVVRP